MCLGRAKLETVRSIAGDDEGMKKLESEVRVPYEHCKYSIHLCSQLEVAE